MEEPHRLKPVIWIGSSRKDLKSFPDEVRDFVGHVLYQAQMGAKDRAAKPLLGFGGAGVLEIIKDYHTDTYRAVYTLKFDDIIMFSMHFKRSRNMESLLQNPI